VGCVFANCIGSEQQQKIAQVGTIFIDFIDFIDSKTKF